MTIKFKLITLLFLATVGCGFFFMAPTVLAQDTVLPGGGSSATCTCTGQQYSPKTAACQQYCGDYGVDDFTSLAIQVAKIILGLTGSLSLLVFIYGGVIFLTSAGNRERITRGRTAIIGAVIGIIIVFASYTVITFVLNAFGVPNAANWATIGGL